LRVLRALEYGVTTLDSQGQGKRCSVLQA